MNSPRKTSTVARDQIQACGPGLSQSVQFHAHCVPRNPNCRVGPCTMPSATSRYYNKEAPLCIICPYYGNLNPDQVTTACRGTSAWEQSACPKGCDSACPWRFPDRNRVVLRGPPQRKGVLQNVQAHTTDSREFQLQILHRRLVNSQQSSLRQGRVQASGFQHSTSQRPLLSRHALHAHLRPGSHRLQFALVFLLHH